MNQDNGFEHPMGKAVWHLTAIVQPADISREIIIAKLTKSAFLCAKYGPYVVPFDDAGIERFLDS